MFFGLSLALQGSLGKKPSLVCDVLMRDLEQGMFLTCEEEGDGMIVFLCGKLGSSSGHPARIAVPCRAKIQLAVLCKRGGSRLAM